MTKYKIDMYVADIYVKTYFVDAYDSQEAHDKATELLWEDLMLDTEAIED